MTDTIRVNGKGTDGLIHAAHPTERFKTLCGWEPPLDQRWYTESRDTPTCPKCIEMTDTTEHDDPALAVIAAARAVLKHVASQMLINPKTLSTRREVGIFLGGVWITNDFHAGYSDFPDTLLGTLAGLRAAFDEYDETTVEGSEGDA